MTKARIARTLGLDRRAVDTWPAGGAFPERKQRARRAHPFDAEAGWFREQMQAGEQNAAHLARELRARGIETSDAAVRRYLAEVRRHPPQDAPKAGAVAASPGTREEAPLPPALPWAPTPSPRETAWLLRTADATPERLTPQDRAFVDALCTDCSELAIVRRYVAAFVTLLAHRDGNGLAPWLEAAETTELRSFAAGIRRDHDAVLAAILLRWSNGQVEGQVNRLKLLKRTMYGRAGFRLLRQRGIAA
jgi:transposase